VKPTTILAAAAILATAACDGLFTGPDGALRVRTDGTRFVRDAQGFAQVSFTAENRGADTVYLAPCGERVMAALDRLEQGRWVQHSGDACLHLLVAGPFALAPGATHASFRGVMEPGVYRIRPGVHPRPGAEPEWRWTSNRFTVE
jgi:hypothetical protein